jgi:hypothetical protein
MEFSVEIYEKRIKIRGVSLQDLNETYNIDNPQALTDEDKEYTI